MFLLIKNGIPQLPTIPVLLIPPKWDNAKVRFWMKKRYGFRTEIFGRIL